MADIPFDDYHERNLPHAQRLRGRWAVIFGTGMVGSTLAEALAQMGLNLLLIDRDTLSSENLHRHAADPRYVGRPKAYAMAWTLQRQLPNEQIFRAMVADVETLEPAALRKLIVRRAPQAEVVIAATGRDPADRRLNLVSRDLAIPLVVPGMYAPDHPRFSAEIQVVPWGREGTWPCFECLHPALGERLPLDAQPGLLHDVWTVAAPTVDLVDGLLIPDQGSGRALTERIANGRTILFVEHLSRRAIAFETPQPRATCPTCQSEEDPASAGANVAEPRQPRARPRRQTRPRLPSAAARLEAHRRSLRPALWETSPPDQAMPVFPQSASIRHRRSAVRFFPLAALLVMLLGLATVGIIRNSQRTRFADEPAGESTNTQNSIQTEPVSETPPAEFEGVLLPVEESASQPAVGSGEAGSASGADTEAGRRIAISDLRVTELAPNSFLLRWSDIYADEDHFFIFCRGCPVASAEVPSNSRSFIFEWSLSSYPHGGARRCFDVRAEFKSGSIPRSPDSNEVCDT